jgi:hypothetical protein
MYTELIHIRDNFQENVKSVNDLMNFDDLILSFGIRALERVNRFIENQGIQNPSCDVTKELNQFKQIRSNKSLKPHYQIMLNQCVVLLVSYFSSAVEDIFTTALTFTLKNRESKELSNEDLKLTIADLQLVNFNLSDNIGELFASKKDISFQDMKNIARAFKTYLGFEPLKNEDVNNIILAQACRHAIVHSGALVKDRTIKQVSHATARELKQDLCINQRIMFTSNEIITICTSMTNYLHNLIQGVSKNH